MITESTKKSWIETYFKAWAKDIERAEKLLMSIEYYQETMLVLFCYVGALGAARFPGRADWDSYQKIVCRYSGLNSLYSKVDLLFFLQWPRSYYRRSKEKHAIPYRKIKGYSTIKRKLIRYYGNEQSIAYSSKKRYVPIQTLLKRLDPPPKGVTREGISKTLKLFAVSTILYRYFRCAAVHENHLPLVDRVSFVDGSMRYKDSHLITSEKLLETVKNIVGNLKKECVLKDKFPWELYNR
jgi:hypothetical protein